MSLLTLKFSVVISAQSKGFYMILLSQRYKLICITCNVKNFSIGSKFKLSLVRFKYDKIRFFSISCQLVYQ